MNTVQTLELGQKITFLDKKSKLPDEPNSCAEGMVIGIHPHSMFLSKKYWVASKKCQNKVGIYWNPIFKMWTEYEGPGVD